MLNYNIERAAVNLQPFPFGGVYLYIYPDHLTAKPTLWLWSLHDIGIIGVGLLISILATTQAGVMIPLVITALYAFLSIQFDGTSILDFIRYAGAYFIFKQQEFEWRF